jgi:hypothetical protein
VAIGGKRNAGPAPAARHFLRRGAEHGCADLQLWSTAADRRDELASPIFVGLWARLQTANSNSLGFPAASFYSAISSTPSLVHDVKSGNNGYGGYGYKAATGWDYPTGWGSLDIAKLSAYIKSNGFAH